MKVRLFKSFLVVMLFAAGVIAYRGLPALKRVQAPPANTSRPAMARPPHVGSSAPNEAHQLKVLEVALKKKPGHAPVLFEIAKIESEQGHFKDAAQHLQELLRSEPGNKEARLELGKDLFQLGDVQGAIAQTESILRSDPNYEDALYNLGAIYGNLGNRERAASYWKRLIALDPRSESGMKAQQMMSHLQASTP